MGLLAVEQAREEGTSLHPLTGEARRGSELVLVASCSLISQRWHFPDSTDQEEDTRGQPFGKEITLQTGVIPFPIHVQG